MNIPTLAQPSEEPVVSLDDLDDLEWTAQHDAKHPICTVRVSTSYWSDQRGVYQRRDIRYLSQLSRHFNLLKEEVNNVGAIDAIQSIVNFDKCEDGIYEVLTCNESYDHEGGYVDGYDLKLTHVSKEREAQLRQECKVKKHTIYNSQLLMKNFIHKQLTHIGPKFLHTEWKKKWTPKHPTTGYCYLISEIMYHYVLLNVQPYMLTMMGNTHWFLKDIDKNTIVDHTAEQFSVPVPYEIAKRAAFYKGSISTHRGYISKRAFELAKEMGIIAHN